MSDWIGMAVIAVVILCVIFGFSRLSKPYDVSSEEFERRAQEGPGLLGASLVGLQKALDPSKEKAAEVLQDLKQGRYDGEQGAGEPPDAGQGNDDKRTNGETDAKIHIRYWWRSVQPRKRTGSVVDRMLTRYSRPARSAYQTRSLHQRRSRHHVAVPTRRSFCY